MDRDCCTCGRWLPRFRRSKLPPSSGYKEAECSSEIFVATYQTTRCHNRHMFIVYTFIEVTMIRQHKAFVRQTDRHLSIVGFINVHCSMAALNKAVLIKVFTLTFLYHRIHHQMNSASNDTISVAFLSFLITRIVNCLVLLLCTSYCGNITPNTLNAG